MASETAAAAPGRRCDRCPRLSAFLDDSRRDHPDWHNAPVPSFGALDAAILVVGLAPGLKGANRTGRPFTGDHAGELLYPTLAAFGLARGRYGAAIDDGFTLVNCRISNAARCVPPANRPLPAELAACRPFLTAEMAAMPALRAILALGRHAHDQILAARGVRKAAHPFAHAAVHHLDNGPVLVDSYHCSRYNTNTGRLTPQMFRDAVAAVVTAAQAASARS